MPEVENRTVDVENQRGSREAIYADYDDLTHRFPIVRIYRTRRACVASSGRAGIGFPLYKLPRSATVHQPR